MLNPGVGLVTGEGGGRIAERVHMEWSGQGSTEERKVKGDDG